MDAPAEAAGEGETEMLMLTRKQLEDVLNLVVDNDEPISESHIQLLYRTYGDEYYKDYGESPYELCVENPHWKDKRGQPGYPRKGYKW